MQDELAAVKQGVDIKTKKLGEKAIKDAQNRYNSMILKAEEYKDTDPQIYKIMMESAERMLESDLKFSQKLTDSALKAIQKIIDR